MKQNHKEKKSIRRNIYESTEMERRIETTWPGQIN